MSRRVLALLMALAACGSEPPTDPFDPGDDPDPADPPPPAGMAVSGTFPAANADGVQPDASISATFTEPVDPASVAAGAFTVSGGVTGTVSVSGSVVSFAPSAPLSPGTTYQATVAAGIRSTSGRSLESQHRWSFTTATPPVSQAVLPLVAGKQWRYLKNDTNTVSAVSTGTSSTFFEGERFVRVADQLSYQGRQAWRVVFYDYNTRPSTYAPAFSVNEHYLSSGPDGLYRWTGQWRRMMGNQASFTGGTFFMAVGPARGDLIEVSGSQATVPAGTFTTVRTRHFSEEYNQYATEHWTDLSMEHWASGTGLVRASWNFYLNDRDPQAADFSQHGSVVLTHVDTGPFPTFSDEAEPNDGFATAGTPAGSQWVVEGHTRVADAGTQRDDADVDANVNGVKLIQDWYRMVVTATTTVAVRLAFVPGSNLDLDLYAFQAFTGPTPGVSYLAKSNNPGNAAESLSGSLSPGTYYFAIQAWQTGSSPVRYWLSLR